jgi:acyl-CoA reductase-like NAD-dependent aldehyde dehydrogenase
MTATSEQERLLIGETWVPATGSTATGRAIVRASADSNLKRLSLELGGKAPSIIARDADIDAAVAGCLQGGLLNSGQVCAAYTWGGFKASGWGREFSHQALDAFTETKSIFVGLS